MHTLRYFAYTLKNAPTLIRYRFIALTCLVGRHSRHMSAYTRLSRHCLSCVYATDRHAVREACCDGIYKAK